MQILMKIDTMLNQIYLVRQKNYANYSYIVFVLPRKLNTRSTITENREKEAKMILHFYSTSLAFDSRKIFSKNLKKLSKVILHILFQMNNQPKPMMKGFNYKANT